MLKPFLAVFVREVLFPLLCYNDESNERWDADPIDYVRSSFGPCGCHPAPDETASS